MMKNNRSYEPLWQDRDIRFDAPLNELQRRPGEKIVEIFAKVEDTKGNTGELGKFTVTNLRLIWQSLNKPRINLTIGFNCITTINNRLIHTKLRGKNESLHMMTKVNGTRYEFIFIQMDPVPGVSRDLVESVGQVCKAYVQTKLYRDLRLRSAIISPDQKQLRMLQSEQIYNTIQGVWNLSSDQGNLGSMYLTNYRIVWHANINELFNISLPYIQIRNIKVRESKFGLALVIESSESSGGYVLGFRVDPVEKLNAVYEELNNLYTVHSTNPDFGVNGAFQLNLDTMSSYHDNSDSMKSSKKQRKKNIFSNDQNQQDYQNEDDDDDDDDNDDNDDENENDNDVLGNYQELEVNNKDYDSENGRSRKSGYDPVAAYLADDETTECRPHQWTYVPELGLSVETIKEGFTLESLWQVVDKTSLVK